MLKVPLNSKQSVIIIIGDAATEQPAEWTGNGHLLAAGASLRQDDVNLEVSGDVARCAHTA